MKILPALFIALFFCTGVRSQVVTLTGTVSDSLNAPLAYATLIAKPTDPDRPMQFTATNTQGDMPWNCIKIWST